MRPSGSLRHLQGSFVGIIAGSGPERSTYPAVRICTATSHLLTDVQAIGSLANRDCFRLCLQLLDLHLDGFECRLSDLQ